uniref:Uncharacterized protein n=1 Tax=Rhizobium rhizogenes TaxID=359 RepID=A0A7S4ZSY5_RHIRH|nr:hypothetical protein pC6.5c_544 [Rhizobium rhizogenes]
MVPRAGVRSLFEFSEISGDCPFVDVRGATSAFGSRAQTAKNILAT